MPEFIDRAKLEAEALRQFPRDPASRRNKISRDAFLAGAAAYAALLDAETTEEWSHYKPARSGLQVRYPGRREGNVKPEYMDEWTEESRRVTPWLPSEVGEKP